MVGYMRTIERKLTAIVQEIVTAGNGEALTSWTYADWQTFLIGAGIGMDKATHLSWLRVARVYKVVKCTRGFWYAPGSMYGPGENFGKFTGQGGEV